MQARHDDQGRNMERKWHRDGRAPSASRLLLEDPAGTFLQARHVIVNEHIRARKRTRPSPPQSYAQQFFEGTAGVVVHACYSEHPSTQEAGMSLCANCLTLTRDTSGVPGHVALRIVDTQRRKIPRSVTATISTFRCSDCGAIWRYRDAKDDDQQGWSLLATQSASEGR